SGEVLQADPYVAAALERQLGDARADHVAADDRNGPRQLRTVEHFEVGVERRAGRRQAEAYARAAAAQIIRITAEVELDERPGRQAAGAMVGERGAQEAGLEDRDARTQPVRVAQRRHVADVAEAVGVYEVERAARQAVVGDAAEVDRAGVEHA